MYGYVYKTTNSINNKIYVGQKKAPKFLNEKYLGSGTKLKSAIKHYGKSNFTVEMIDFADSKEDLDVKEVLWIEKLNARDPLIGYNLSRGGDGNSSGVAWNKGLTSEDTAKLSCSEEHKRKTSESLKKAYKEGRRSLTMSDETKKKMSESAKNRPHPPTTSGRVCYTDGVNNKMLKESDIEKYVNNGWHKGKTSNVTAWNKGLTAEISESVAKYALKRKQVYESGGTIGCYGVKGNNFQKGGKLKDIT